MPRASRHRGTHSGPDGDTDTRVHAGQEAVDGHAYAGPNTDERAFSFTGRYVARRLLDKGVSVRTLTRKPDWEDPFGVRVPAVPLDFSDPDGLHRSLQGAGVLYNTYWIRFGHGRNTFEQAVANSRTLFEAAARAGVGRIVHFSVANASADSRIPYFRGFASKGAAALILSCLPQKSVVGRLDNRGKRKLRNSNPCHPDRVFEAKSYELRIREISRISGF